MSRIFICLFGLFILSIAVRFGDCKDEPDCNNIKPGSEKTRLTFHEKFKLKKKNNMQTKKEESLYAKANYGIIYPGTLWCGAGNKATNENELGPANKTDACCRTHDFCSSNILAGETKANLINNGGFTRSACTCDGEFYACLKNAGGLTSFNVRHMYFTLLKPQCFECVCPEDGCDLEKDHCNDKCKKYKWSETPK